MLEKQAELVVDQHKERFWRSMNPEGDLFVVCKKIYSSIYEAIVRMVIHGSGDESIELFCKLLKIADYLERLKEWRTSDFSNGYFWGGLLGKLKEQIVAELRKEECREYCVQRGFYSKKDYAQEIANIFRNDSGSASLIAFAFERLMNKRIMLLTPGGDGRKLFFQSTLSMSDSKKEILYLIYIPEKNGYQYSPTYHVDKTVPKGELKKDETDEFQKSEESLFKIPGPLNSEDLRKTDDFFGWIVKQFQNSRNLKLKFITVNHVVPTLEPYLRALRQIGDIVAVIAKSSTADPSVMKRIKEEYGDAIIDDKTFKERLKDGEFATKFVEKFIQNNQEKIIIIDIGGYFAPSLESLCKNPRIKKSLLGIVEDTENGHQKYAEQLSISTVPIYSVARCPLKKTEDWNVGKSIVEAADTLIRKPMHTIIERFADVAVVGFGKIGSSIAFHLRQKGITVTVFEINPRLKMMARSQGFITAGAESLINFSCIFGASGVGSIMGSQFGRLPENVIIASCTSSDDEFDLRWLKDAAVSRIDKNNVSTYYLPNGKRVNLLNNGDSVNFVFNGVNGPFIYSVQASLLVAALKLTLPVDQSSIGRLSMLKTSDYDTIANIWDYSFHDTKLKLFDTKRLSELRKVEPFSGLEPSLLESIKQHSAAITERLNKNRSNVVCLYGDSGMMKTDIALMLAEESASNYHFVRYFDASGDFFSQVRDFVDESNDVFSERIDPYTQSEQGLLDIFKSRLSQIPSWLLVIDNLEEVKGVAFLLDDLIFKQHVILITNSLEVRKNLVLKELSTYIEIKGNKYPLLEKVKKTCGDLNLYQRFSYSNPVLAVTSEDRSDVRRVLELPRNQLKDSVEVVAIFSSVCNILRTAGNVINRNHFLFIRFILSLGGKRISNSLIRCVADKTKPVGTTSRPSKAINSVDFFQDLGLISKDPGGFYRFYPHFVNYALKKTEFQLTDTEKERLIEIMIGIKEDVQADISNQEYASLVASAFRDDAHLTRNRRELKPFQGMEHRLILVYYWACRSIMGNDSTHSLPKELIAKMKVVLDKLQTKRRLKPEDEILYQVVVSEDLLIKREFKGSMKAAKKALELKFTKKLVSQLVKGDSLDDVKGEFLDKMKVRSDLARDSNQDVIFQCMRNFVIAGSYDSETSNSSLNVENMLSTLIGEMGSHDRSSGFSGLKFELFLSKARCFLYLNEPFKSMSLLASYSGEEKASSAQYFLLLARSLAEAGSNFSASSVENFKSALALARRYKGEDHYDYIESLCYYSQFVSKESCDVQILNQAACHLEFALGWSSQHHGILPQEKINQDLSSLYHKLRHLKPSKGTSNAVGATPVSSQAHKKRRLTSTSGGEKKRRSVFQYNPAAVPFHKKIHQMMGGWDGFDDADLHEAIKKSIEDSKKDFSFSAFEGKVAAYNLALKDVEPDGNCFFYAVAHQLQTRYPRLHQSLGDKPHETLRALAVGALVLQAQNKEIVGMVEKIDEYVAHNSKDKIWANDYIISALARVLKLTIVLVNNIGPDPLTVIHAGNDGVIFLGYQVGVHFLSATGDFCPVGMRYVASKSNGYLAPLNRKKALSIGRALSESSEIKGLFQPLSP